MTVSSRTLDSQRAAGLSPPSDAGRPVSPGLYVHIPFCVRKCHYCDFNSDAADSATRRRYLQSLQRELHLSPWKGATARTLFLGGGTPSELKRRELEALIRTIRDCFRFEPDAEWTMECNPGTVDRKKFSLLRQLGFNRISLGVQSFHDRYLTQLGRSHDSHDALEAIAAARAAGFDNINLDLIFAIPGQSLEEWETDLRQAFALSPTHLSLYNLTIEPGTEFGRRLAKGRLVETDEETSAAMFEAGLDLSSKAGFRQYEISNYSLPGMQCRHNLIYWRNQPYLGFGVSAASYVDGLRWTNAANWERYFHSVEEGRSARMSEERLSGRAALGEEVMLGLRTSEGVSESELERKFGLRLSQEFPDTVQFLKRQRLLEQRGDRLCLTRRGLLVANEVCAEFL